MYDHFTDTENYNEDQDIATRVPMGNGFAPEKARESGSRYPDKRIQDADRQRAVERSAQKRDGGGRRGRLFAFLTIVLLVLILCAVAAIVLLQGNRRGTGHDGGLQQNAAEGDGQGNGTVAVTDDSEQGASDENEKVQQENSAGAEQSGNLQERETEENPEGEDHSSQLIDLGILQSPYAVLMDAQTGEILASKRSEEKIFPASMTKILTVLTAIEHIPDLDRTIYMEEDFYEDLYDEDASRAGFEPGEEAVIRDLLYGALLPSGAECCIELARQAAGSESAFVDLMNQKAADLGLVQTHFTNCTGLHNEEEFSTCAEIAKILQAAMQNETFFAVFTTHHYSVEPTDMHPDGFTFWSTLFKATVDEIVTGGEIIGGKTGFTEEAGHCLASAAEIYGKNYILVTAGWAEDPENELYHIDDAFLAYNELGSALS